MSSSPVQHPNLYLDDGDVVFSAQNSTDRNTTLFKVHKTMLSVHSEIFRDMFRVPSPEQMQTYDGVPLVHLPDNAEDLAAFFTCLYNPTRLVTIKMDAASSHWKGLMRIATKYFASSIREAVIHKLEEQFPTSFAAWCVLDQQKAHLHRRWIVTRNSDFNLCYDNLVAEPAAAVRFAREFNVPSILPAAFYELSLIDPDVHWDTCRANTLMLPGGNPLATIDDFEDDCLYQGDQTVRWDLLNHNDFRGLIAGRDRLRAETFDHLRADVVDVIEMGCIGMYHECEGALRQGSKQFDAMEFHSVLRLISTLHTDPSVASRRFEELCEKCMSALQGTALEHGLGIWGQLPDLFRLDA